MRLEPISNRWWPLSNNEGVQFNYPRNPKQTASYITAPNSFGGKTRFINDGIETLVGSYETDQILNNPFNWLGLTDRVYFRFQSIPGGNFYYALTLAQGTLSLLIFWIHVWMVLIWLIIFNLLGSHLLVILASSLK